MADYSFNAELYDNPLTEKAGDFIARAVVNSTTRNADIARRIKERGSELEEKTITYVLDTADEMKAAAVARGESVVDGMGQYLVNITGTFESATAKFNPAIHSLGVSYNPGKVLRELFTKTTVNVVNVATTGPVIGKVTDSKSKTVNDKLTPNQPCVINGSNLKIVGDEATVGVFFIKDDDKAITPCSLIVHNNPSELTVMIPALADGLYRMRIVTNFATGSKQTKEPRSTDFHILLTVGTGGGGSESPDEI
ncbi:MAG: DUF4469 domain-containing protein [Parabacteroides sp.]|nr:DUF4469 domain-containing protein [Parabacteroides sp.]